MPFPLLIPLLTTAASGIAGALSNKKSARTGEQSGTSTTMPVENHAYATLGDMLRARATERLRSSMDLSGLEASGISDINSTFDPVEMSVNNSLTSRGLGTSPVAGAADATLGAARGGSIAQWLNQLPTLKRQYQNEDFNAANMVFAGRPLGQTTQQQGTVVQPGSVAGGGIGSAAEMLAFMAGQGLLGGGGGGTSTARTPTFTPQVPSLFGGLSVSDLVRMGR